MENIEQLTSNIQHPIGGPVQTLGVGGSMLDVRCLASFRFLDSGLGAPAYNMALDEALLEAMPRLQAPVLRFYAWTEPAATFGYFQKISEVESVTHLRPLIRRPTGGGIVPHDADWTYSLAIPPNHAWYELRAEESYRSAHEWVRAGFARLNIETELAPCCKKSLPGQCFVGYEKFDVLWRGKKIAGAAQRRNKLGLLIQGSVQPPPLSLRREDWQQAMRAVGGVAPNDWQLDGQVEQRARQLAQEKFSNAAYNSKR